MISLVLIECRAIFRFSTNKFQLLYLSANIIPFVTEWIINYLEETHDGSEYNMNCISKEELSNIFVLSGVQHDKRTIKLIAI